MAVIDIPEDYSYCVLPAVLMVLHQLVVGQGVRQLREKYFPLSWMKENFEAEYRKQGSEKMNFATNGYPDCGRNLFL